MEVLVQRDAADLGVAVAEGLQPPVLPEIVSRPEADRHSVGFSRWPWMSQSTCSECGCSRRLELSTKPLSGPA